MNQAFVERVLGRPELISAVGSVELVCQTNLVAFHEHFGFSIDVGTSPLMRRTPDPCLQGGTQIVTT